MTTLTEAEVSAVIEGRGAASRIPASIHFWTPSGIWNEREDAVKALLDSYPNDIQIVPVTMPDAVEPHPDNPEYRWVNTVNPEDFTNVAHDARVVLDTWENLDEVLNRFPSPDSPLLLPDIPVHDGRYRLGQWWYCFFERLWSIRGMTNALMDFYLDPDSIHSLFRRLTDFYLRAMERSVQEAGINGIFCSDDIGMQTAPFFSTDIFRTFLKPYYRELITGAHNLGIHFWLHSCGNIEAFLEDFIEIGLDVIHPIQKYTMDESRIAESYGSRICIWGGFDVQKTIPFGTPEEVREEVRNLIDTFTRPEGRFMITCSNGLTEDTPLKSLEALLDESCSYRAGTDSGSP